MRSRTHGPSSPRHSPRSGRPPVVTRACGSSDARPRRHELPLGHRVPSIPSTESAREQNLGDDLFHEPEAQPKFVTAEAPPETTVGAHHCGKWLPSVIQAPYLAVGCFYGLGRGARERLAEISSSYRRNRNAKVTGGEYWVYNPEAIQDVVRVTREAGFHHINFIPTNDDVEELDELAGILSDLKNRDLQGLPGAGRI